MGTRPARCDCGGSWREQHRAATRSSCPTPGCGPRGSVASTGANAHAPRLTVALVAESKMEPARSLSADERVKNKGADTAWKLINLQMTKSCAFQENG